MSVAGRVRHVLALSLALAPALLARRAEAQPADAQQIAVAQALVDEGRKLVAEGKLDEACPKFEGAVHVAPSWGIGALAQLAECYEKAGRLASAWGTWVQVASAASRAGQAERAQYAHGRVEALAPRLPRLTISVPETLEREATVTIFRDGSALNREQAGVAIPVDPGRHSVRVTAPNKAAWATEIEVRAGDVQVFVPAHLEEPTPGAGVVPHPAEGDAGTGKGQRIVGLAVGAVGVVGLTVAGGFLVENLTKGADYLTTCKPCTASAPDPYGLREDAIKTRTAAIVSGAVGAAALGSGIAIYATAPSPQRVAVTVGPGAVSVSGTW